MTWTCCAAALGDRRLTYLGKSYGTYLGAWYAQLFPRHVRALVLDGALDPDATSTDINITQGEGFEVALRSFTANCMRLAGCPLGRGSDVSAGIARLQGLLNRATRTPLANDLGDGRPANGVAAAGRRGGVAVHQGVLARADQSIEECVRRGRHPAHRAGGFPAAAQIQRQLHQPGRREHGDQLPRPALAARADGVALDRFAGREGGAAVRRVDRLGQPGLRLLAGKVGIRCRRSPRRAPRPSW